MNNNTLAVWKYFKRDEVNKLATCIVGNCKKISAGSTKSLWDHLESKHSKEYSEGGLRDILSGVKNIFFSQN